MQRVFIHTNCSGFCLRPELSPEIRNSKGQSAPIYWVQIPWFPFQHLAASWPFPWSFPFRFSGLKPALLNRCLFITVELRIGISLS